MNTESAKNVQSLTRTRLLARNTLFNLLGQVAPLIAAIFAIPLLISGLGTNRFGVLTLAWMVLGYFGLFDLGLGRVVTKLVGEKLGAHDPDDIPAIFWTGLFFMFIVGIISMLIVLIISPSLVYSILKIPATLQKESLQAFIILGFAVPIVTISAGLRGTLEAYQKFGLINIVRTANGLFTFLAPLAVIQFSFLLRNIVIALAIGRIFILGLYFLFCLRTIPALDKGFVIDLHLARPMFRLGGWMSVSNIIGPVMVYFDRFLIGAWLSVAAVAYYVTPYEVVTKLMLVTAAVARVLFPAFSTSYGVDDERTALLYSRGIRISFLGLFPLALLFVVFAHPGMKLWLGAEFADRGAVVLQWLAIGVLLNAPGQVAFALVQAAGRPDLTAKLHLAEAPFYLFTLWFFVSKFGITGAAIAWTLRILVDTIVLLLFVQFIIKKQDAIFAQILIAFILAGVVMISPMVFFNFSLSVVYFVMIVLFSTVVAWKFLLHSDEKYYLRRVIFKS